MRTGLRYLFRQFSFPGGIGSHVTPETPGSIHEGGELGYALVHAFGAAFDNPDLVVFCVVGDGEAETGPLAASWHSNKFVNPAVDGTVIPILALNGYKIANPTVLDRIPERELINLFEGYGYEPHIVAGDDPMTVHAAMAATMDAVLDEVDEIKRGSPCGRPRAAALADDHPPHAQGLDRPEGRSTACRPRARCRSHQVPLADVRDEPRASCASSRTGSGHTDPTSCSTQRARSGPTLRRSRPPATRRMSANPHANGGRAPARTSSCPTSAITRSTVAAPGTTTSEATRVLGAFAARRHPRPIPDVPPVRAR